MMIIYMKDVEGMYHDIRGSESFYLLLDTYRKERVPLMEPFRQDGPTFVRTTKQQRIPTLSVKSNTRCALFVCQRDKNRSTYNITRFKSENEERQIAHRYKHRSSCIKVRTTQRSVKTLNSTTLLLQHCYCNTATARVTGRETPKKTVSGKPDQYPKGRRDKKGISVNSKTLSCKDFSPSIFFASIANPRSRASSFMCSMTSSVGGTWIYISSS